MMWSRAGLAPLLLAACACGDVRVASDGSPGGGSSPDAAEGAPDGGGDGGDEDASVGPDAAGPDAPPADRIVFVTSQVFTGAMGGLAGADAACQAAAAAGSLPGSYLAWLSDATGSPASRMNQGGGPFHLTDGTAIAADWADLTDGSIATPIDRDELGRPSEGTFICQGGEVWTNTTAAGAARGADACTDWTSIQDTSSAGNVKFADASWTESECSVITCESGLPIYCVQQ
ncbi:MAG TPA: hypothetical protein VKB80_37800 [Kofleriaceae bacterium]|nr:hypothetical protein [Kofleriaceae bacterium]